MEEDLSEMNDFNEYNDFDEFNEEEKEETEKGGENEECLNEEDFFSEQLDKLKRLEDTIEKSLKNSITTLNEYTYGMKSLKEKYEEYRKSQSDYRNQIGKDKEKEEKTKQNTEFETTIKKMEEQIEEIEAVNFKFEKEIESINQYTIGLKSRITGTFDGEGYADPDDNKYNMYIKITKHGLKLSEAPVGEGFENMINKVVYETSANISFGQKNLELFYKDYSDGAMILFIEIKWIYQNEDHNIFGVFNFQPLQIKEDLIKDLIQEAELDVDETLEEFYEDFLLNIFKGIDYYANTSLKRSEYYLHYLEEGTFQNLINFN